MYSQMNCLIENDYIKGTFQKKTPMYSQRNCLIENDYIKGTFQKKKHLCIPKWIAYLKTNTKGKKRNKNGKKKLAYFITGGFLLLWTGSWRTLLRGGLLTPCEHYLLKHIKTGHFPNS